MKHNRIARPQGKNALLLRSLIESNRFDWSHEKNNDGESTSIDCNNSNIFIIYEYTNYLLINNYSGKKSKSYYNSMKILNFKICFSIMTKHIDSTLFSYNNLKLYLFL